MIQFYLNNAVNLRPSTPHIMSCYTHKMAIVFNHRFCDVNFFNVFRYRQLTTSQFLHTEDSSRRLTALFRQNQWLKGVCKTAACMPKLAIPWENHVCSGDESTGRRLLWSTTLLLPTLLSDSQVSISLVIHGLWWTVSGQVKAHVVPTCTNGVSPNHLLVTVASDRPWTTSSTRAQINKIWRWTESSPRSGRWRCHMTGMYSDCSTREIINTIM